MLSFYSDVLNLAGRDIFWSAIARNNKLVALSLDRSSEEALAYFETLGLEPDRVTKSPFKAWISELKRYEAGEPVHFQAPIEFEFGTSFQRRIWNCLEQISPGQTLSYQEVANRVNSPRGSRATGGACGKNPIPLRVPCHRVINSSGELGGFTGEMKTKRALLLHEQKSVSANTRPDSKR